MTDAISRSALLRLCDMYTCQMISRQDILKAPALDAVPVVRCVDCKHRCTPVCLMYHAEYCDEGDGFYDDYYVDYTDDDGFCHLGERREGEEDE